jgi:hypothetical protein
MARVLLLSLLLPLAAIAADAPKRSPSVPGARVYFISPADGESVASPVTVRFGLSGMGVAPAGIQLDKTGHHHLLVDAKAAPPPDQPIPMDDQHRHFGGGQTEVELALTPGTHTLQLLLADYLHVPHDPPLASAQITITVK